MRHEQLWLKGDTVPVRIRGLDEETSALYSHYTLITYLKSRLDPLDLDLEFEWDAPSVKDDEQGGISISFDRSLAVDKDPSPFHMRKQWGFKKIGINDLTDKYFIASIHINLNVMDLYPEGNNRDNAFKNVVLHEFLHALGLGHLMHINIDKKKKGMLETVMKTSVSTDKLYWDKSTEVALKRLYGGFGKRFEFSDDDLGKTVYFLHWFSNKKSFALPIDRKVMYVPGVKNFYKKVIK